VLVMPRKSSRITNIASLLIEYVIKYIYSSLVALQLARVISL
jgi:hypothetical protein